MTDFRDLQCSLFNSMSHNGRYYDWLPYTKNDNGSKSSLVPYWVLLFDLMLLTLAAINSCALNCYPDGEDFFVTLTEEVVDGTSCSDDIGHPAVCADGTCLVSFYSYSLFSACEYNGLLV